jgi:hypothetical protein
MSKVKTYKFTRTLENTFLGMSVFVDDFLPGQTKELVLKSDYDSEIAWRDEQTVMNLHAKRAKSLEIERLRKQLEGEKMHEGVDESDYCPDIDDAVVIAVPAGPAEKRKSGFPQPKLSNSEIAEMTKEELSHYYLTGKLPERIVTGDWPEIPKEDVVGDLSKSGTKAHTLPNGAYMTEDEMTTYIEKGVFPYRLSVEEARNMKSKYEYEKENARAHAQVKEFLGGITESEKLTLFDRQAILHVLRTSTLLAEAYIDKLGFKLSCLWEGDVE